MLPTRTVYLIALLLCAIVFQTLILKAHAQTASSWNSSLQLRAALVLPPEFCATNQKSGNAVVGKIDIEAGEVACAELEPSLKGTFSSLTRITDASLAGDAQVVLLPRVVGAARTNVSLHDTEKMLLVLELTIMNASLKTVWIGTVDGIATDRAERPASTKEKRQERMLTEAVMKDVVWQLTRSILESPELRKLAESYAPKMEPANVAGVQVSLTIESVPTGADVEIDGAFVGNTPSTLGVAAGKHQILVKKKGFSDWSRTLNISGGSIHLLAELEQAPAQ